LAAVSAFAESEKLLGLEGQKNLGGENQPIPDSRAISTHEH
jgi:hypothetical protein